MRWQEYIEQKPGLMMGKATFKGTRITVEHVLLELAAGTSIKELLAGHPRLTESHIRAALLYAARHVNPETPTAA